MCVCVCVYIKGVSKNSLSDVSASKDVPQSFAKISGLHEWPRVPHMSRAFHEVTW